MSEELFPSGPWTGFYTYAPEDRHRMYLHLTFVQGALNGDGQDDVGAFLIRGRYDETNRECYWTKTYPGSHDVHYRGFREGKGIWGQWEIGVLGHGGFHIWPRTASAGDGEAESNKAAIPVTATEPVIAAAPWLTPVGPLNHGPADERAPDLHSAQKVRYYTGCS